MKTISDQLDELSCAVEKLRATYRELSQDDRYDLLVEIGGMAGRIDIASIDLTNAAEVNEETNALHALAEDLVQSGNQVDALNEALLNTTRRVFAKKRL